jgi:hypothetical protein
MGTMIDSVIIIYIGESFIHEMKNEKINEWESN